MIGKFLIALVVIFFILAVGIYFTQTTSFDGKEIIEPNWKGYYEDMEKWYEKEREMGMSLEEEKELREKIFRF